MRDTSASSRRRPGPTTPGVSCNRKHLPHCRKRESSPYGSRRGGRDDVGGWLGFIFQTTTPQKDTPSRSRRAARPRIYLKFPPQKEIEGAGKTGCALHPRSRVQKQIKDAHEHTGSAEAVRPSLRNGFTAYFALSLATGFFVTIIRVMRSIIANLTPASGRQDHTTSPSASRAVRQERLCVHRIPPRVRDDREPPLCGTGQHGIGR